MREPSEHTEDLDGLPVFWREAPAPDPETELAPVLYLHGVPTSSDDWTLWLALSGGLAVDLPGFGRSGKPGSREYTIEEYDAFIERFLDWRGIERVRLVMHDWGAVGLAFAQRRPERVRRMALINVVPLLPGYRWHRTARAWRTPVLGELAMGATVGFTLKLLSRESNVTPGPLPEDVRRSIMEHLDQGTQRAILRLYRSSPPERLAAAGEHLGDVQAPALVAWGTRDPYIPERFAREYARALPHAELLELPDAGHWPWLDRPDLPERVHEFLART
ncbi:MAG TPA: alpha/beta hydrolase [Solirubrobacteraceae bacterium]|nr:alpha/beta hydrolase [Solirubrobacteraceae bacterium]